MNEILPTFPVMGLSVHICDDYVEWLRSSLWANRGNHVVTYNAEMAIQAEKDRDLSQIIRDADLVIPDGAGVVLYLRLKGKSVSRCPGIELAESLLESPTSWGNDRPIFFYGGTPSVSINAADAWRKRVPNLAINSYHGYLSEPELADLKNQIQTLQPRLILVGLGVPRQEIWIRENRHLAPNSTWIGVGGSFDIWAGVKNRAPGWLKDNHLEWLYRLYKEPWRWRRMLALPEFAFKVFWY